MSDKSILFSKVLVRLCYKTVHYSSGNERFRDKFCVAHDEELGDFDFLMISEKFPSITFGSSSVVELYSEIENVPESKNLSAGQLVDHDITDKNMDPMDCSSLSEVKSQNNATLVELVLDKNVSSIPGLKKKQHLQLKMDPVVCSSLSEVESQNNATLVELFLDKNVSFIPGLKKTQRLHLEECGLHTFRQLFHHFPRIYADCPNTHAGIIDGEHLLFYGHIKSSRCIKATTALSYHEIVVVCENSLCELTSENVMGDIHCQGKEMIYLHLKKFFRGARFTSLPFLRFIENKYKIGDYASVNGKVRSLRTKNHYELSGYELNVIKDVQSSSSSAREGAYPIYPSKKGLSPTTLKGIISRALLAMPNNIDPIPENITQKFGLLRLHEAYVSIHQPKDLHEAELARTRLVFDDFLYIQIGRLFQRLEVFDTQIEKEQFLDRFRIPFSKVIFSEEFSSLTKFFLKALKYSLTSSQMSAVLEIIWDLKHSIPMNRLLQGDVGCGKTVVAFLACMEVISSGHQAAVMAPTELLAIQHYEHLLKLLEYMDDVHIKPTVALLTGSTPLKQAKMIREGLQRGVISLVIGTHSLLADSVVFLSLRIAVVDEQHRFGVIQRGRFTSKLSYASNRSKLDPSLDAFSKGNDSNVAPHILALSATPIPRSLALALYGDMCISHITELPPGRRPVETHVLEGNKNGLEEAYKMMLQDLESDGKIFLVYALIEQSETQPHVHAATSEFETICQKLKGYACGLLHGKMSIGEKEEALGRFRRGETRVLVCTRVIEVGVDVPDASMLVVMNAEKYGMAALHQMRGRVGRSAASARPSKCILLPLASKCPSRLKVLERSSDGFYLANLDLQMRGPGELVGKKQSGHLPHTVNLETDGKIIHHSHLAALEILSTSYDLEIYPGIKAELSMRQPLSVVGD